MSTGAIVDRAMIERAIQVLTEPGDVTELRAFGVQNSEYWKPHVESGYFDDRERLANAAFELSAERAKNVYVTLNPVDQQLLSRASNRVRIAQRGESTKDTNIVERRWLPIDIDPTRSAGIGSSSEERTGAFEVLKNVVRFLSGMGWPDPIIADSGNGFHLLYRVRLKPDDNEPIAKALDALAFRFDTDSATVDRVVYNASRIWKLYGTPVRKGILPRASAPNGPTAQHTRQDSTNN